MSEATCRTRTSIAPLSHSRHTESPSIIGGILLSGQQMLQVKNVCKTFDGGRGALDVLRDICFDVAAGEFISIIGPSGCGKTTLLRILHGLEPTTSGVVSVSGKRVEAPSPSSAMVFQQFNLFPWLTVARNVAFGLEVAKFAVAQRKEMTDRFIRLVGLQGFSEHYPHELSGGMQQRVGLARALALDPDVLLLDEPFGALDAITREQLQREIAVILAQSPKTVVFITHNMDEAIFFSDRILVMGTRPGRILEEVRVDLPRPREADAVRASHQFANMREHLWSLLSQGVKAA
jgi:NitT/TauT family transport system ATP-binding protein